MTYRNQTMRNSPPKDLKLECKVAVVIGSTAGIGRAARHTDAKHIVVDCILYAVLLILVFDPAGRASRSAG